MKQALAKALHDSFDKHERRRELQAEVRRADREARAADERVRQLRRAERERAASGRAA